MKKTLTSSDINVFLRLRYAPPEYALCFEVANATGSNVRRYADAVAMCLYPSRGLALHGFEVKVSKGDFLREIENPDKSIAVQQYCDFWWLVAPAEAVDESLIPITWGWLKATKDGLTAIKNAPRLEAKATSRDFLAAMVRRANEADNAEVTKLVEMRVAAARERDQEHIERMVKARTQRGQEAIEQLDKLRAAIGKDSWDALDEKEIAAAVKAVRRAGIFATYSGLKDLTQSLKHAAQSVEEALLVALPQPPE